MFKRADGSFALDGGKIFKELVQSLPSLEVIQQALEWNSGSAEHRGPPENIGVPHDNAVGLRHSRIHLQSTRANSGKPTGRTKCWRFTGSVSRLFRNLRCPLRWRCRTSY